MATTNPIPTETQCSILLPWVDTRTSKETLYGYFRDLEWGVILKIDMIYKKELGGERPKKAHYKVFIHFGGLNPKHSLVFEHLATGQEIKVNHRFGYWKVRRSCWERNSQRTQIPKIEFIIKKQDVPKPQVKDSSKNGFSGLEIEELEVSMENEAVFAAPERQHAVSNTTCSGCQDYELYGTGENQLSHMGAGGCLAEKEDFVMKDYGQYPNNDTWNMDDVEVSTGTTKETQWKKGMPWGG
jgi:hypothetical protein